MLLVVVPVAMAQDAAGIHRGAYSPAFQQLMQQNAESGTESCVVPTHSQPPCKDGEYDPGTIKLIPMSGAEEGCSQGEIIADLFEPTMSGRKTCRVKSYCYCGRSS
jgi:hypothetical protein